MLASTAARVLSWYFKTRDLLDSPVQFTMTEATRYGDDPWQITSRWDVAPSARRRETLLAEVSTIGLALARVPERDRAILECRYDPDRGVTDRQLAEALGCDREGARAAHTAALVALGGQLVRMGLIHMNGRPTWAGDEGLRQVRLYRRIRTVSCYTALIDLNCRSQESADGQASETRQTETTRTDPSWGSAVGAVPPNVEHPDGTCGAREGTH